MTFEPKMNSIGDAFALGRPRDARTPDDRLPQREGARHEQSLAAWTGRDRGGSSRWPCRRPTKATPNCLLFLTFLSANLAVINFLPIPVLDGGHFVLLAYEGIRGKAGQRKRANRVGLHRPGSHPGADGLGAGIGFRPDLAALTRIIPGCTASASECECYIAHAKRQPPGCRIASRHTDLYPRPTASARLSAGRTPRSRAPLPRRQSHRARRNRRPPRLLSAGDHSGPPVNQASAATLPCPCRDWSRKRPR